MSKRPLELEIRQGNARHAVFESTADPDDVAALERILSAWLDDDGWKGSTRARFSMVVRYQGERKPLKTIREPR
jgi:hypothetical protein